MIRDAASVILLRDGAAGIEAWLLTRVRQMAFAAGMSVFPGGRVDVDDAALPWAGRPAAEFAARFGCAEDSARSFVGAAVREVFEETGVLLTVPSADLGAARDAVEAGTVSFGALLREHGLAVDADAVHPWARWITPEGEARRYDARFFVAALPDGAQPADLTSESSVAGWVPVVQALAEYEQGTRRLMPPTLRTLQQLAGFGRTAAVLSAASDRSLEPIRPRLRRGGVELPDGSVVTLPDGAVALAPEVGS